MVCLKLKPYLPYQKSEDEESKERSARVKL